MEKIENSPILGDNLAHLQKILLKSFKEVIVDYSHSDAFKRDTQLLPINQRSFYTQLGDNSEFSYINITLNGKTQWKLIENDNTIEFLQIMVFSWID